MLRTVDIVSIVLDPVRDRLGLKKERFNKLKELFGIIDRFIQENNGQGIDCDIDTEGRCIVVSILMNYFEIGGFNNKMYDVIEETKEVRLYADEENDDLFKLEMRFSIDE